MTTLVKPRKGTATRARARRTRKNREAEGDQKQIVRDRDRRCRFPVCGCWQIGAPNAWPEVSHDRHKGMGGNPTGDRSTAAEMILLCHHRHQGGIVSRDRKTLRVRALTDAGNAGPVAFEVKRSALVVGPLLQVMAAPDTPASTWVEVARERAPHELARLLPWQVAVLAVLAEMTL